jgi:hypothetical protein
MSLTLVVYFLYSIQGIHGNGEEGRQSPSTQLEKNDDVLQQVILTYVSTVQCLLSCVAENCSMNRIHFNDILTIF